MEQILLTYGFPKETIIAIIVLYKTLKAIIHSPDGETDFFDIVTGVLQVDTLAPYLLIILRTSIDLIKENGFTQKRQKTEDIPQKLWQTPIPQIV